MLLPKIKKCVNGGFTCDPFVFSTHIFTGRISAGAPHAELGAVDFNREMNMKLFLNIRNSGC